MVLINMCCCERGQTWDLHSPKHPELKITKHFQMCKKGVECPLNEANILQGLPKYWWERISGIINIKIF